MEGSSRHFPGPCHYSVTWKTPRCHHWARTHDSNFFQAHYSVCQEHKPLIYVQHAGEVTPYLANPAACLKEEGGQNLGLGTGMKSEMRGRCTGPSFASHVVVQGFAKPQHSTEPAWGQGACTLPASQLCARPALLPVPSPSLWHTLGCQLFPCSFCFVPGWWQTHILTLKLVGNWPKQPWGREFTLPWFNSTLLSSAFTLPALERSIPWEYSLGREVPGPQLVLLSTWSFLLNAQVMSQVSWADESIEQQLKTNTSLKAPCKSADPTSDHCGHPSPPSFSTDLHQDILILVPSTLSLNSLPWLLSHSTCSRVGGYICTFINTSIMPCGLAGGAALWI